MQIVALAAILLAEFIFFQRVCVPRQDWIYPRWFDQVQYLREAYQAYEYSLDHGFFAALREALASASPQGTLHGLWGLLIFTLCGPSRASALAINMSFFVALQAATFFTVWRISRGSGVAWISVGFLAALLCPWSGESASAVDFRLDWMAACSYGIALGAGIAGKGFRSTRWALLFGVAVGAVVLTRTLTAVYFTFIFSALLAGLLARPGRWARCGRLILSGLTAAAIAGPSLWIKRHAIHDYYWIGHVAGPERALRDSHLSAGGSMVWMLSQVFLSDIGVGALILFLATLGALLALRARPPAQAALLPDPRDSMLDAWGIALAFFLVPIGLLCVHPVKASQPPTIVIAPAVWLAVLGCLHLSRRVRQRSVAVAGAAVVLAGLLIFSRLNLERPYSEDVAVNSRKMNVLADYFYFRSEECALRNPSIAVTLVSGGLNAEALTVLGYERHQRWLHFEQTMPTGLFETTPQTVMEQLRNSDFVCLLTRADASWPFDREMTDLLPVTRPWCEAHMRHLADLEALGDSISVYERRTLNGPGSRSEVDLAAMLASPSAARSDLGTGPPAAPVFNSLPRFLLSVDVECAFRANVAYSPMRFRATGLPAGLELDARTGTIRGRVQQAGAFVGRITATNTLGSAASDLVITAARPSFLTEVSMPAASVVGAPVAISYEAFDASTKLDFLDVNDLTAGKLLDRLTVDEDSRQVWQGLYWATFREPGMHTIKFRFVRFDPNAKEPYSYEDDVRRISITTPVSGDDARRRFQE